MKNKLNNKKDQGMEFEIWIMHELPWQLNLSLPKDEFVKESFSQFADYVRPLAEKAPEEFDLFFQSLKEKVKKAGEKNLPKGYRVIGDSRKNQTRYPNGKPRPLMIDYRDKCAECGIKKMVLNR